MNKIVVMSLGGSLIIPGKINISFIRKFRKAILRDKKNKFIIVCGGGALARRYISQLKEKGKTEKQQAYAGIKATKQNAQFMINFFKKNTNKKLPNSIKQIERMLEKNKVIFLGSLKYGEKETSDGTAAKMAHYFKTSMINMTNVKGLYDKNPLTNKNAKFMPKITWKNFEKKAKAEKFELGQHFILDQYTATAIKNKKIKTYIIGRSVRNLKKLINNKKFSGTIIEG